MKRTNSLRLGGICLLLFFLTTALGFCQSLGDLAFIAFNADGDKDFAIVTLAAISPNTTFYFTDDETTGEDGFVGSEGVLTWSSGTAPIAAGTVVVFTDVDQQSNPNFGVSIGTITRTGAFSISSSKDGIIAYTGSNASAPTTYIAAIQIGNDALELGPFDADGITLSHTGLRIGSTIVIIDTVASPDGGAFKASRSNKTTFSAYLEIIADDSNWTTLSSSGDGESLLPFVDSAFTTHDTTWTAAQSSSWHVAENWSNGIPSSASIVSIPNTTTAPIITSGTAAEAGNLVIEEDATLSLAAANALTVHGSVDILGVLNIASTASLIVTATSTGVLTYTQMITDTNWHFISAPVTGQDIDAFVASSNLATGTGSNIGFSEYENSTATWSYYQSGGSGTGNFTSGQGHAIKKSASGNINFTGTFNDADVSIPVTKNTNGFNLIGNPYLAAVSVAELLTENNALLEEQTIWLWDQAQDSYVQKNLANDMEIAPGQGFFVLTNTAGNFNITEAMQSHAPDTFQKGTSSRPEISLTMNNGTENSTAEILYLDGATTGWDNGYDSSIFEGLENAFQGYTQVVENGTGKKLGIQSLPNAAYENSIIPIGLKATAGNELTFALNAKNLPEGMMVFLEDRVHNTTTRLDETDSAFKTTLDADLNGVGRFYLLTSSTDQTLSVDDASLSRAHVFMSANRTLKITGLQSDKAVLKIHSILGKTIIDATLKSGASMQFKLPSHIKQGVYIVSVTTKNGSTTKKIFIQ